jgi:predicted phage terminase large subunit-like protein
MNLVNSDSWLAIQLPIAEEYPPQEGKKLISCWPDRFTNEAINESYADYKNLGKASLWFQEHMLVIAPKENLLYSLDNIKRYNSSDMVQNLNNLTYYISIDLAVSERNTADYTSIAIIGVNENNHWFLIDGTFGRFKPDDTIDKLFKYVMKYRPYTVVMEGIAFQMAMKTFIQNEMVKRGIFFSIDMVSRTTQKLSVFKALQPIIELGRFWVPNDTMQDFVEELLNEMAMVTNDKILATHDDLLDSIAQLTLIEVIAATPISNGDSLDIMENEQNPYIF